MQNAVAKYLSLVLGALLLAGCASGPQPKSGLPEGLETMQCGQARIAFVWHPEPRKLDLTLDGRTYRMVPVKTASGARFEVPTNEHNYFWNRGDTAELQMNGELYPQCVAPGALEVPFVAQGNEPFWRVELLPGQLWLEMIDEPVVALSWQTQVKRSSSRVVHAEDEERRVQLRAGRQLCRDSMTGMPYPYQVQLSINGSVYQGCGGTPEHLIRGIDWYVTQFEELPVVEGYEPELRFFGDNQLAGNGGCNSFTGRYELTGEGMTIAVSAETLNTCGPDVMEQERQLLAFLDRVVRFDAGANGELLLVSGDAARLVAVRALQEKPPWER